MTLNCLRCGGEYDQPRRRASHFCPSCRLERNRERNAERQREVRAAAHVVSQTVQEQVDEYVRLGMDSDYAQRYHDHLDDLLGEMRATTRHAHPDDAQHDRMPAGANSPAGPDDGTSTYFTDLADELDAHHRQVAAHPWFEANPHWSYRLHDDTLDLANLRAS